MLQYGCVRWTPHKSTCVSMSRDEIYKVNGMGPSLLEEGGACVFIWKCCQPPKPLPLWRICSTRYLLIIHSPKCGLFLIFRMKLYKLLEILSSSLSRSLLPRIDGFFYLVLKALRLLWTYHIFSQISFYSVSFSILTRAQNVEIQKLLTSFLKCIQLGHLFPEAVNTKCSSLWKRWKAKTTRKYSGEKNPQLIS